MLLLYLTSKLNWNIRLSTSVTRMFPKCKSPSPSSWKPTQLGPGRLITAWPSYCKSLWCLQIAYMTLHQVSSASKELRLIGSHRQINIPKWQHLISSFCPVVSPALSLPLPRLSVTLQQAPLPHYLPTPQLTNKYTVTWMNKHVEMRSVFLLCTLSPDIFALSCLSAFQVTSCCLKTTTLVPQLPI